MIPRAHVVHHVDGRLRLRIPERKKDHRYFETVMDRLNQHENVHEVQYGRQAGSVLIHHQTTLDDLRDYVERLKLFQLVERAAAVPVADKILGTIDGDLRSFERFVGRISEGQLDLMALTFGGMIGAGVSQCLRGNVLPPGASILSKAVTLLYDSRASRAGVGGYTEPPSTKGAAAES